MAARIKVLEGHRDKWRRYAWRLEERLASKDMAGANEVMTEFYSDDGDELPPASRSESDVKGEKR